MNTTPSSPHQTNETLWWLTPCEKLESTFLLSVLIQPFKKLETYDECTKSYVVSEYAVTHVANRKIAKTCISSPCKAFCSVDHTESSGIEQIIPFPAFLIPCDVVNWILGKSSTLRYIIYPNIRVAFEIASFALTSSSPGNVEEERVCQRQIHAVKEAVHIIWEHDAETRTRMYLRTSGSQPMEDIHCFQSHFSSSPVAEVVRDRNQSQWILHSFEVPSGDRGCGGDGI